MKREQIRAPASFRQASCLKPACFHRKMGVHAGVKERSMQSEKCYIYEADNLAYTKRTMSHIRDK
ncbi:hypothetical protein EV202_1326 [Bacteroides heparinolyticus]|uniref:Uncharacterized protein n=1 Tax=Prevotella heparinolytica TaxID=28113 RepID=A0A4R2LKD4_9BACE|nr:MULTISPECIES: hypothetical protein [Bacteroides]TCO87420.1 hypothetical protein EV202_1326 [Bacteroides heparinolyticus]